MTNRFSPETVNRNWEIYRMRVKEKRTLLASGQKFGLCRERVRQIVAKCELIISTDHARKRAQINKEELLMGQLDLSYRIQNALGNYRPNFRTLTVKEFCDQQPPSKLFMIPNLGRTSIKELLRQIEGANKDVSDIWTAGHGENYNPTKHGRRGS